MSSTIRRLTKLLGIYKVYERILEDEVKKGSIPKHIAFILDGNRRWAYLRNLPPWMGHKRGAEKVKEVLKWCYDFGIETVTLYILSTENLMRDRTELEKLFEVIRDYLHQAIQDEVFHERRIRVKAIGKLELLPGDIRSLLSELESKTIRYDERFLNIAIAYGGRSEIVEAAKRITKDVIRGIVEVDDIDESLFESYLFTSYLPNPHPDLVIRTSGETRLSNFLLWQAAYSELIFLDVYWPDFRKIDFLRAIRTFQRRSRRFGR